MFTGIVEETASIAERTATDAGLRLRLATDLASAIEPGESLAVSGVCVTAEEVTQDHVSVFLAEETRERTYLEALSVGDEVNIERPLPADGRLDGHLVQGHVDGTTHVADRRSVGDDWRFAFALPDALAPYLVEKGSIAVDGISLTIADLSEDRFEVAIIPETYERTTLDRKGVGDPVHLEVDVIARYVHRQLDWVD